MIEMNVSYSAEVTLFHCVQMLMQKLSPEEYILATISLYLDVINLFIHILRILQTAERH
jgi:FtsH-binding integral membrane protein